MRKLCLIFLLTMQFIASLHAASIEDLDIPALNQPVIDKANLLSPNLIQKLNTILLKVWQNGGSQIVVLTLPSLKGQTIEQVSIQIVDHWKLGEHKKDNGILLLISKAERKIRIEVGQGLEGSLPDAYAKRIIDESISPLFKARNFDQGVLVGVYKILEHTDPNLPLDQYFSDNQLFLDQSPNNEFLPIGPFFVLLILFIILFSFFGGSGPRGRGRRRISHWHTGGFPSTSTWGRGGGFSGGGGGFSGRGGGFSGGGASGSW